MFCVFVRTFRTDDRIIDTNVGISYKGRKSKSSGVVVFFCNFRYYCNCLQMAYLYSMFKNQVEEYCEFSEMENCVDELTRFGLKRLRELSENHLDEMDPYQRGASSISEYLVVFFLYLERVCVCGF